MKYLILFITFSLSSFANETILSEISTCPTSPNCKSSLASSKDHRMDAWPGSDQTWAKLKKLIIEEDKAQLIKEEADFYHFVYTSFIFRFKDDVYFYYDRDTKLIHFKSSSRTGHSDLGANERRLESIKKRL